MHKWEARIGIEVHAQVRADTKLFSRASTQSGAEPNINVNLFDIALPGTLPSLNAFCVSQAIKTALGIKAKVNQVSAFDRKHYIYPDIPAGYQITQYYKPIAQDGQVVIKDEQGFDKVIRIAKIQLEQDAGKIITVQDQTFIDYNRAGCALMEIISEADLSTAEEAAQYVGNLRNILLYLGTCDGNMQEGSLRADINVSIHPAGSNQWGTRCEIKNLNSIRFLKKAIKSEIDRQINVVESGNKVEQNTMLFDEETGQTKLLRNKGDATEYLYLPDPNLPDLKVTDAMIEKVRQQLVELPDERRKSYIMQYKLSTQEADILVGDFKVARFFEEAVSELKNDNNQISKIRQLSKWIVSELFAKLNACSIQIDKAKITPKQLIEIINLLEEGIISNNIAKSVFAEVFMTGISPAYIVESKGLQQISDVSIIDSTITIVMAKFAKQVQELVDGKQEIYGWLVGQIMKAMQGKGNPKLIAKLLTEKLVMLQSKSGCSI